MTRLYIMPIEKGTDGKRLSRELTTADFNVNDFSWSPDSRTIVFSHQPTPSANDWPKVDLSLATVADTSVKPLATSRAAEDAPSFSPDGKWIAFLESDDPPTWAFTQRVHVMAAVGGTPWPLADTPDSQPAIIDWSADGSRVYVSETDRVTSRIYALAVDGSAPTAIGPANLMVGGATLNAATTTMGFVSQEPDRAPEAFVAPVAPTLSPTQVSRVQPALEAPLAKTETIAWKSADGTPVEGLLTYRVGFQKGTRAPLVVIVHGGPTGVFTRTFVGAAGPYPIAAFAANGFAILRCNVRGSSGYVGGEYWDAFEKWRHALGDVPGEGGHHTDPLPSPGSSPLQPLPSPSPPAAARPSLRPRAPAHVWSKSVNPRTTSSGHRRATQSTPHGRSDTTPGWPRPSAAGRAGASPTTSTRAVGTCRPSWASATRTPTRIARPSPFTSNGFGRSTRERPVRRNRLPAFGRRSPWCLACRSTSLKPHGWRS
jgi:hypothetical protein